jgi:hypothetical protein
MKDEKAFLRKQLVGGLIALPDINYNVFFFL